MTYQVTLIGSGLVGWQYLQQTIDTQIEVLVNSSTVSSDLEYFKENIGKVETAEDLVSDYRLLSVALSAFGMEDQIDYKALLQQVLEEGVEDDDSLANRLSSTDSRFVAFAEAFNFTPVDNINTVQDGFGEGIVSLYEEKSAEEISLIELDYEERLAEYAESDGVTEEDIESRSIFYEQLLEEKREEVIEKSEYFMDNIAEISSADALIFDAKLLEVSLVAFEVENLSTEDGGEYFLRKIQKVLEQGASDPNALANVLGDKSLINLAEAFGFDNEPSLYIHSDEFYDELSSDYITYTFEGSVGDQQEDLRYALNFQRAIPDMADATDSDETRWYQVLANDSLREVFQTALGLPDEFAYIDIDKQLEQIMEKANTRFGISSFDQLGNSEEVDKIINTYLIVNEALSGATSTEYQIMSALFS